MTPAEYLRSSFEGPDREYLDGEIVERSLGENPHSKAQSNLVGFFYVLGKKLPLYVRTEMRMQVTATRFRVADVAVYAGDEPVENIPSTPPVVAIEILSSRRPFLRGHDEVRGIPEVGRPARLVR